MSGWAIFFWLIITFLCLYPLNRWISLHIQGVIFLLTGNSRVSMWILWTLFLPGTFLHEFSHWLTANLLGVQASRFTIWPQIKQDGEIQLGVVQLRGADPVRHSLIGLAPLLFGSGTVLVIGLDYLELNRFGLALSSGELNLMWQTVLQTIQLPDVWLWFYLIFAVSNAMLPSSSDREFWSSMLVYLGFILIFIIGFGLTPNVSPQLQDFGLTIMTHLLYAFIITIVIDLLVISIIIFIETFFAWVLGRYVQYY